MFEILAIGYPWIKALHIISVIAWMAGLFYMPRLFVYHVEEAETKPDLQPIFEKMELKLLRVIMNPAMIATWVFGVLLALVPGVVDWSSIWPYTKTGAIIGMTWFHHWLGLRRKDFLSKSNTLTGRNYRLMNEVPTVLLIIIVISVVVRPF
ncbi:protoporphyrinogen oxidase HemJ [Pseudaestuariivita rosea]|uniref:protoporphyrinogen oxidase HemJ n=1 Tax=Pseudaestuariivita rosea TaxID=2763263 RepID=UPI001ABA6080|nr:protoporphyrinogen oxidase HemJ [Pseudaestuariivita rosea]